MVNVAALLEKCPRGMELDSTICNDLYFDFVGDSGRIHCFIQHENYRTSISFYPNGTLTNDPWDRCVIFPKGKTTWEGFQIPFEDGEILSTVTGGVFILQSHPSDDPYHHCYVGLTGCGEFQKEQGPFNYKQFCTRASKTEKQKLFDAIKANGYSWDSKTKVLKKTRIEPGDIVVSPAGNIVLVSNIDENGVVHFLCRIDPSGAFEIKENVGVGKVDNCRLANDCQTQALLKCLASRGYKYNPGAKAPKKLIEPMFKGGDVAVSTCGDIHLLRTADSSYCAYRERWTSLPKFDHTITTGVQVARLATEKERQKLFDTMKERGFKWNFETKTLEGIQEFKDGDIVSTVKIAINDAVQRAVSNAFNKSDIQNRIYSYGCSRVREYVRQSYENGKLVACTAKEAVKNIDAQVVLALIDIEELKAAIVDRVAKHLIEKL